MHNTKTLLPGEPSGYFYYPAVNEDGWRDADGNRIGYSAELDRSHIIIKVMGLLTALDNVDLARVSNGMDGDLLSARVADRCMAESRFDQYSILLFILELVAPGHAEYWAGRAKGET